MDYKSLGTNIKKYRVMRHMTQAKLAEEVGCADNYITALEKGRSCPSLEILMRIVDVLNVTPNQLLVDSMASPELVYLRELEETIRKYPTAAKITACDTMRNILKMIEQLQNK